MQDKIGNSSKRIFVYKKGPVVQEHQISYKIHHNFNHKIITVKKFSNLNNKHFFFVTERTQIPSQIFL